MSSYEWGNNKKKVYGDPTVVNTTTDDTSTSFSNEFIEYILIYVDDVNARISVKADEVNLNFTASTLYTRQLLMSNFNERPSLLPMLAYYDGSEALIFIPIKSFVNIGSITLSPTPGQTLSYSLYIVKGVIR